MINNKMTLKQIVDQLELCDFQCEGGSISTNSAFIELKELVYGKTKFGDARVAWAKGNDSCGDPIAESPENFPAFLNELEKLVRKISREEIQNSKSDVTNISNHFHVNTDDVKFNGKSLYEILTGDLKKLHGGA